MGTCASRVPGVPPDAPCPQLWDEGVPGLVGQGYDENDGFGAALAAGDFNGDGYSDLAIGSGSWLGLRLSPRVTVLYGSQNGLGVSGNQEWSLTTPGILGDPSGQPEFGSTLAVGYFNGDSYADLVIGAPGERDVVLRSYGAVHILYGSVSGLSVAGNERW